MPRLDFQGRHVGILGFGRDGRAAWRYLRARFPELELTLLDENTSAMEHTGELTARDRLQTGPLSEAGLDRFDVLVRSPGISPYRDSLRLARASGTVITTPSNLWFADHPGRNTVCITGTKGKSTTSALLAHMLRSCGFSVRLAGNIGRPLLSCDDRGVDWWVIELSSYQLADLEADPAVSVLLNLTPEHLDWHGSEEQYRKDKLRLVRLAGGRPLIANASDPVLKEELSGHPGIVWFNDAEGFHVRGGRLYRGARELHPELPPGLPGSHNRVNLAAALTALGQCGADLTSGLDSLSAFAPLPHRLQLIGEREGCGYVDDSISSTPVATAAALEAFAGRPVTLLVGGLDRGLDWAPHMEAFRKCPPDAVIGMPDNGSRILDVMRQAGIEPREGLHAVTDLEAAVALAGKLTRPGGIVLLSPGAPSFPHFRDYRERGLRFAKLSGFETGASEDFGKSIK